MVVGINVFLRFIRSGVFDQLSWNVRKMCFIWGNVKSKAIVNWSVEPRFYFACWTIWNVHNTITSIFASIGEQWNTDEREPQGWIHIGENDRSIHTNNFWFADPFLFLWNIRIIRIDLRICSIHLSIRRDHTRKYPDKMFWLWDCKQ